MRNSRCASKRRSSGAPRILWLLAAALAACEAARPPPCPGSPVATFDFTSTPVDGGSSCTNDAGPPPTSSYKATVAWDPVDGGAAAFCIQRPYAQPHLGTHAGDQITVESTLDGYSVSGCSCPGGGTITIRTVMGGSVVRDGGTPVGFSGFVQENLSAAGDCGCNLPCAISYTLEGK